MRYQIWLKLLRIHTSCLTQAGVMLGAIIGGVRNPLLLVLYALFALAYHGWGFLDNNLCDLEYDRKDPAKKHFPLVTGEISLDSANILLGWLLFFTFILGLILSSGSPTAIVLLILSLVAGLLYNRACKRSLYATIYITVAFTSLPLFSYFTVAKEFNPIIVGVAVYTIFLMVFQISVSGYLKDLETDPVNLLRSWGAKVEKGKFALTPIVEFFSGGLKALGMVTGVGIWIVSNSDWISGVFMILLVILTLRSVEKLLWGDNKDITKKASMIEIFSYFYLVFSLQGILGWVGVVVFVIYPIVWFVVLNRLTWKTLLRPKV